MRDDPTPIIGTSGTIATALLAHLNSILSLLVGLASLGYVLTKWWLLWRRRRDD